MVGLIDERLIEFDRVKFLADRNEIDLTAFRLQVIGEAVRKISDGIKEPHPEIPWKSIVAMRNFIAHDYEGIAIERVWDVASNHLAALTEVCRTALGPSGLDNL
jgi:uncharacterized protein with HEPN domain